MKLLKDLSKDLDSIDIDDLSSVEINESTDPIAILSVIGLIAPILIKILEAWKLLPGRRQEVRNMRLDKSIAALRIASVFSSIKFNK